MAVDIYKELEFLQKQIMQLRKEKNVLEERLDALVKKYGASYVDAAIAKANATGRAFQEYFLYRGTIMSQYLTDIEHILLDKDEYYQIAEQVESGGEMHNEPR